MKGWEKVDNCPACGAPNLHLEMMEVASGDFTVDWNGMEARAGYRVAYTSCAYCGLSFQDPRPTEETINSYYSTGQYRKELGLTLDQMDKDELARSQRIEKIIKENLNLKPKRHLDIGCSRGYLLNLVGANETLGVDMNPDWVEDKKLTVVTPDNLPEPYFVYDLITMIHVLEHVNDPNAFLDKYDKLLSDKGTLVIEVPYRDNPYRLVHPIVFNPVSLIRLMSKHKLVVHAIVLNPSLLISASRI